MPVNQKQPMSIEILKKMFAHLDFAKPADLAFWAVCCVGFFGFLMKGSVTLAVGMTNILLKVAHL